MLILSHLSLMSHIAPLSGPPADAFVGLFGSPLVDTLTAPLTAPLGSPSPPTPLPRGGSPPTHIIPARLSPKPWWVCVPTAAALPRVPLGLTPAPDTTTAPLRGRLVSGAAGSVAGGVAGVSPPPPPPRNGLPSRGALCSMHNTIH
jgi:hypothetical protein